MLGDASKSLQKLYFRIGEVAEIVGVEPHVLRYWETEFRSIRPRKSAKGQRVYSQRDVESLRKVKDLLYAHGFTIAGAKKKLREGGVEPAAPEVVGGPSAEEARRVREALVAVRGEIVDAMGARSARGPLTSFEVLPGVRFEVTPPSASTAEAIGALPTFELGPLRGAEVAVRAGFVGNFGTLRLACARAPSTNYAPGVEDVVLGRATQIARDAVPAVTTLESGPAVKTPTGFVAELEGRAEGKVVGKHVLAFASGDRAALCTALCAAKQGGEAACVAAVASAKMTGALGPPPPAGRGVSLIFAAAEHPIGAAAALALVAIALMSAVVKRRPRRPLG